MAPLFFLRDFGYLPARFFHRRDDRVGLGLRVDFDVFALVLGQLGLERRRLGRRKLRMQRPIFHRRERADLAFPLHDHPQRHGLHAPGRKAAPHLIPQQRRNLVPHQAIQHATRLLRVHQVLIDLAGMLEGRAYCPRRDFVEHHPENMIFPQLRFLLTFARLSFLFLACAIRAVLPVLGGHGRFQNFRQMRADGFAFTIGVGGQVDGVGFLRCLSQALHDVRLVGADLVGRLEVALDIDAQLFLGQIHDVAVGRLDRVVAAEIFVDRLRLCGRLDDD